MNNNLIFSEHCNPGLGRHWRTRERVLEGLPSFATNPRAEGDDESSSRFTVPQFIFLLWHLQTVLLVLLQVLEVRPVIDWNKGKAVEFLLESLGLSDCDDVLPIYVGDDKTDEDAFKVNKSS